jgi:hypothetical protein
MTLADRRNRLEDLRQVVEPIQFVGKDWRGLGASVLPCACGP